MSVNRPVDWSHDLLIGGASSGIDEHDLTTVDTVRCDQFANKDRIRTLLSILDLEK